MRGIQLRRNPSWPLLRVGPLPHPSLSLVSASLSSASASQNIPALDAADQAVGKGPWDVVVIGSGIGGLVTASQLAVKGARVLVLERYLIPGGSGGSFRREGYTFDVGASMIFGFGQKGHTNLLTRALADVGEVCETIADPAQLEYHGITRVLWPG